MAVELSLTVATDGPVVLLKTSGLVEAFKLGRRS
jgi:hypothetical protein